MLTPHISVVQVPVNAIGKKRSRVFFFPKLSLNFICFGPSPVLVGNVKSGALVPTVSGITNLSIRSTITGSKVLDYCGLVDRALRRAMLNVPPKAD
jgi:hypothetical protein